MNIMKSTPEDHLLLLDRNANPADRATAAECLAADGYGKQIHPILDDWINDEEFILRETAITLLLGTWGHQKYVGKTIEMLQKDSDFTVRETAAYSLTRFCADFIEGEKYKNQIIQELLRSLVQDDNSFVQRDSYKGLCVVIRNEKWNFNDENDYFDCQRDVDWKLLQPYLEKYNLKKPVLS